MRAAAAAALAFGLAAFALAVASAAERLVALTAPARLSKDADALPRIAAPVDVAERRVNAALSRLDAIAARAIRGCKDATRKSGAWRRSVDVPMRGPRYFSVVVIDNVFCGGAHPDVATMAIVYDLASGAPVDWTRVLPPALVGKTTLGEDMDGSKTARFSSPDLYRLYLAGYRTNARDDDRACVAAVKDIGADGPPYMSVWLDAEAGGLAAKFDAGHMIAACADAIVIPTSALRTAGVPEPTLKAIEAARAAWTPSKR